MSSLATNQHYTSNVPGIGKKYIRTLNVIIHCHRACKPHTISPISSQRITPTQLDTLTPHICHMSATYMPLVGSASFKGLYTKGIPKCMRSTKQPHICNTYDSGMPHQDLINAACPIQHVQHASMTEHDSAWPNITEHDRNIRHCLHCRSRRHLTPDHCTTCAARRTHKMDRAALQLIT